MNSKFLIYKASGGLGHMLGGLCFAISLARRENRFLLIDTEVHSAFNLKFSDVFVINNLNIPYSDDYDIIPSHMKWNNKSISEIKNSQPLCKDDYYLGDVNVSKTNINKEDDIVIYCDFASLNYMKNIQIQVNSKIENELRKEELLTEDYIAMHFRNTDKKNKMPAFIDKLKKINKDTNINTLYLASDNYETYDIIKEALPHLNVIRRTIPPKNIHSLHYGSTDKYKQVYECLRDIYYILHSKYFIPSHNSGMSIMIINMINNNNYMIPNMTSNTTIV